MSQRPGVPENPQSRDLVSLARQRTYGLTDRDPEKPIQGFSWIRQDLDPPELRMKVGDTLYKIDFIPVP